MEQYRNIMVKYGDGNKRLSMTGIRRASAAQWWAATVCRNSEQQQGELHRTAYEMMRNWGWSAWRSLEPELCQTNPSSEIAAFGIKRGLWYAQGMP